LVLLIKSSISTFVFIFIFPFSTPIYARSWAMLFDSSRFMFIPSNSHTISSRPTFSIFRFPSSSHLVSRISFRPESSFFCLHISTLIHRTSTIPASTITTNRHSSRTLVLISFQYPTSRRYHVWRCLYITTISDCYIFSLSAVCYALLFSFFSETLA